MGQVYHLHEGRSKQVSWAHTYVNYYIKQGWYVASKYFNEYIPDNEVLREQIKKLIRKEFLRRGIDVTF